MAQLSNAGLADLFDGIHSADEVRALKPAPAPYLMVAERCGVAIGELCLVAAHPWDVSGAMAAGAQAAFVGRGGVVPSPLGPRPAVIGADLTEVADALLAASRRRHAVNVTLRRRTVMVAVVTPLASILGSGLLIIVPVLERTVGALSVFGAVAVCAVAWFAGTAVRHCVRVVEPLIASDELDDTTRRLDRLADVVIVVAYVISVALYLRIMAEYVFGYLDPGGSPVGERILACVAVAVIVAVGVARGFEGLDELDRVTLGVVVVLTTVLGGVLLFHDGQEFLGGGITLPPVPALGVHTLLILGGIVITVQGFETVRYLGAEYDAETRVWASRLAQVIAASIYIGFVAVATPLMGLGTEAGADSTLLSITKRVAPFLLVPLVISAVLSQFTAATADTAAAEGNLRGLSRWMHGPRPFLFSGAAAIALAATVPTYTIVAVASRAFAAYYAIQAVIALRTTGSWPKRIGYGALALLMIAITLFAEPAG